MIFLGCTPKRERIPVFSAETPAQAETLAWIDAAAFVGAQVYRVQPTGSMAPTLQAGDFLVVKPLPYADLRVGQMVLYQARWRKPDEVPVTHWASARAGDEWIMDGEANRYYERSDAQRMGRKEYRGVVTAVYRPKIR